MVEKKYEPLLREIFGDEPVFVLRAKDEFAPETVAEYGLKNHQAGNKEHGAAAWMRAAEMQQWQKENAERVRRPD